MTPEVQMGFNTAMILIGALGGWVLKSISKNIEHLQAADTALTEKVQAVEVLVAGQYVKRDDFDKMSNELFHKLDRIYDLVSTKADKP